MITVTFDYNTWYTYMGPVLQTVQPEYSYSHTQVRSPLHRRTHLNSKNYTHVGFL